MTAYLNKTYDLNSDALVNLIDELPFWSAPFGIELLNNITPKKNTKVLDIGFGLGFPLTEIALRFGETCKIYGIDPWEAAIKRTKKKLKAYNITNTELIKGVAENIPLSDNSVDLIVSNNGINNVENLNKTFEECARVIKKGGQFIQSINLNSTMHEFYTVLESVLLELNLKESVSLMNDQIYHKRKPINEFTALIEQHGFSNIKVKNHEFKYSFTDGSAMFNHYFIQMAFLNSWKEIVPDNKLNEVFSKVENILNYQAAGTGVCKLSIPFVVINAEFN